VDSRTRWPRSVFIAIISSTAGLILLGLSWAAWAEPSSSWAGFVLELLPLAVLVGLSVVIVLRSLGQTDLAPTWRVATVVTLGVCGGVSVVALPVSQGMLRYHNGAAALLLAWLGVASGAIWLAGFFVYIGAQVNRTKRRR
jgi:hypothetical protein